MYILVLDSIPNNFVPVICAHSSLSAHLKWNNNNKKYNEWLKDSYKKCVVSVNQKEFDKAKTFDDVIVQTEAGLGGIEVAIVLCPRDKENYHKAVNFYKLWQSK